MQINLLPNQNNIFVLECYTRPVMKQAKGISSGEGLYACSVISVMFSGKFSVFTKTVLVVLFPLTIFAVEVDLFLSSPVGYDLSRCKLEMSTGHTIFPVFISLLGKIEGILFDPYLCPLGKCTLRFPLVILTS